MADISGKREDSSPGGQADSYGAGTANALLVLLMLGYMLSFVDRQVISLMVGPIRADLGISDFEFSLLQGVSFALFYCALGIPLGRLADTQRRTALVGIGAVLWSLSTMACGLARGFGGLFTARVGVGVGEAALSPGAYSLLSDAFPPERLARAIGIFVLALPLGAGLGFLAGGAVIRAVTDAPATAWPVFGVLKPWQQVFFIVGFPGVLLGVALLLFPEPKRRVAADAKPDDVPSFGAAIAYLWRERRTYAPIFLSIMFVSIAGYAMLNWYPAFLQRRFGVGIGEAGLIIGALYLVCGVVGTLGAPLVSEWLVRRGDPRANLRTVMLVGAALAPFAVLGPLMPTLELSLLFAAPTVILLNSAYPVGSAALQIATPNRMRGTTTSVMILANNLAGMTIGASAVPLLTDFMFGADAMVGVSIAIVIGLAAVATALTAAPGLRPESGQPEA